MIHREFHRIHTHYFARNELRRRLRASMILGTDARGVLQGLALGLTLLRASSRPLCSPYEIVTPDGQEYLQRTSFQVRDKHERPHVNPWGRSLRKCAAAGLHFLDQGGTASAICTYYVSGASSSVGTV